MLENYFWTGSDMTQPDTKTAADNSIENNSVESNSESKSKESIRELVPGYEARINEVEELIARVRHEINNPLAGVLGQAQLLLREELNERARKRAETIEQLSFRLRDIVAQLRQVQKPIKGPED
jgi:signal transduction histidine kinase